ncbi:MAG TPA: 3-isopropylmalate dehydratase small subunit [Blastocatellia bacterium]|nr:3-isopropylmalate dehydratase small subunit [Blastocatellia bacterium]
MEPFRAHTGIVAPLDRADIDTDQIVPKQFLKRIERSGFGEFLFNDWRRNADGTDNPDFVLNKPAFRHASVLVAGANFGCGSSREHAPWALQDFGFRVIIAPSFADIFANNCVKIGLLPIILDPAEVHALASCAAKLPGYQVTADLEAGIVHDRSGFVAQFAIGDFERACLLNGLDEIGLTLESESRIAEYERVRGR